MRLGWAVTTDHFSSRAPDTAQHQCREPGPFYFAWGCFRDFVSRPCAVHRRRGAAPRHPIPQAGPRSLNWVVAAKPDQSVCLMRGAEQDYAHDHDEAAADAPGVDRL